MDGSVATAVIRLAVIQPGVKRMPREFDKCQSIEEFRLSGFSMGFTLFPVRFKRRRVIAIFTKFAVGIQRASFSYPYSCFVPKQDDSHHAIN
jgi:hypothetical protein